MKESLSIFINKANNFLDHSDDNHVFVIANDGEDTAAITDSIDASAKMLFGALERSADIREIIFHAVANHLASRGENDLINFLGKVNKVAKAKGVDMPWDKNIDEMEKEVNSRINEIVKKRLSIPGSN